MPRTRSLAWSELKIGVLTIVAIVIAAGDDLPADRRPRLLLAALHPEDAVRERRRPEARVAGARGRRRGRARSRRSSSSANRSTSTFEVNKSRPGAHHDRLDREARVGLAARRERRRHHAVDSTGTPIPEWGYVPTGPAAGAAGRHHRVRRAQGIDELTALIARHPGGQGHGRQADDRRAAVRRAAAVRRDAPAT